MNKESSEPYLLTVWSTKMQNRWRYSIQACWLEPDPWSNLLHALCAALAGIFIFFWEMLNRRECLIFGPDVNFVKCLAGSKLGQLAPVQWATNRLSY